MKYVVYYCLRHGGKVNRDYPEYPAGVDVRQEWIRQNGNARIYLQHEPHADYTAAFAAAGMVGADPDDQRDWLAERVKEINAQRQAAQAARQAAFIPSNGDVYGGAKPGTIVRDQNGRSGKVPELELEVFRRKPISPDAAMDAVRDFGKSMGR